MHIRILPASAQRMHLRLRPPHAPASGPVEAFVSRVVLSIFFGEGGGGLVEDHNVGGTIYCYKNRVLWYLHMVLTYQSHVTTL